MNITGRADRLPSLPAHRLVIVLPVVGLCTKNQNKSGRRVHFSPLTLLMTHQHFTQTFELLLGGFT